MRFVLVLIVVAAVAFAGCGGEDDGGSGNGAVAPKRDSKGAENAVREYLRALVEKDGAKACGQFTLAYQRSILEQNSEFATKNKITTCPALIDAITKTAGPATFEGQPLNAATVDKIKLESTVRVGGKEQNATVTGTQGLQRYELITSDGEWMIAEVTNAGG